MHFLELPSFIIKPFLKKRTIVALNDHLIVHHLILRSIRLKRKVKVDVFIPRRTNLPTSSDAPCLLMNDGQDWEQLKLVDTLTARIQSGKLVPIVVGVHAGDRMNEYGTAGFSDYMNRGWKAKTYSDFVIYKLLPFLTENYGIFTSPRHAAFTGFSLGGLSALDIVWRNPQAFLKVGVFSGSFWWRSSTMNSQYPDADRIIHQVVHQGRYKPGMEFWLQAGTKDEESDRNNNGVIDAIDDTLDLVKTLGLKGYTSNCIHYAETEGGEHNFDTWSKVFPAFLDWAFKGD
ncbi:MAG: enterochelin esterase-like enzyme [Roseivirga sp.]|jgi:enterochelin esterase-like enzyme